jgi:hypothetical protein
MDELYCVVVPVVPLAGGVVSVVPLAGGVVSVVPVVPVVEPLVELSCFWSQAASDSTPTIARAAKIDFIVVVIP